MENDYTKIRVFFSKTGRARYISHLNLMDTISRAVRRAKIDAKYTSGFNPRIYITFALPLPLGVDGVRETFDIYVSKADIYADTVAGTSNGGVVSADTANDGVAAADMANDGVAAADTANDGVAADTANDVIAAADRLSAVAARLRAALPDSIGIISAAAPVRPHTDIVKAEYVIDGDTAPLEHFLSGDTAVITKKSKKGYYEIDLKTGDNGKPYAVIENGVLTLPAGNEFNINPLTVIKAAGNAYSKITRTGIFCADGEIFA